MISPPGDYAWFADSALAEAYSLIFVRGLTPDQLAARMRGQVEGFSWMTSVGDWTLFAQYNSSLGADDDFLVPLSEGTRLVSLYRLDLKGLEEFRWVEDGEERFAFWAQEGFSEVPEELVETMEQLDRDYGPMYDLYRGPGFVLIERLTGIKLTPRILDESSCLSGVIPSP